MRRDCDMKGRSLSPTIRARSKRLTIDFVSNLHKMGHDEANVLYGKSCVASDSKIAEEESMEIEEGSHGPCQPEHQ